MGEVHEPAPVKLFAGLLAAGSVDLSSVYRLLEGDLGPMDITSPPIDFTFTRYYENEMGAGLKRQFLGFANLISPGALPDIKLLSNEMEKALACEGKRRVNIDPGYLCPPRVVLASTKDFAHRLYLAGGIFGEITLLYRRGRFEPLPWTYPDYQSETATSFFSRLRAAYLGQLKSSDL